MKFDGIILDIDGTIWNTTPIVAQAWNKAIEENFPQVKKVSAEILQGQFGKTMKTIADNLFPNLNENDKSILLEKCCTEEQNALKENTKKISYESVVESIPVLAEKIPLFIVSNCQSGYIEVVLEKNNIGKYIVDSECYGNNGKNKDENIKLIVQRNNLKSPVYIGDTQGDADACEKAGVPFIWASYGFGKVEKYYKKIDKFSEIIEIIEN